MRRRLSAHHGRWLSFAAALLVSLAGLLAAFPTEAATTVVGTIPGRFGVSPTGAATYTIPINVPRGSGGLTPSIALVYNSQSGSGAAGWGWMLSGLSAITRCNQTIDDDEVTQAVQLASTDDYCLDGQRLRQKSDGSYDTEIESFDHITAASGTNGPASFTVQTKNGMTYEYGNTTDSRILATGTSTVRVWALDKVTDANGNYYTVTYQNNDASTGDYWPTDIQYTGNTQKPSSPLNDIHFTWATRSDVAIQSSFVHGTLVSQTQLLTGITVEYNGADTFIYSLYYNNSTSTTPPADPADNRYQLTQVEECAASGSCFSPTTIGWQEGAAGWTGDVNTNTGTADAQAGHLMDVNGDGIEDLVYPGGTDWMVMFGQPGGGLGSPVDTGISDTDGGTDSNYQYAIATDYNGDGRMDLMVPSSTGSWYVLEGTGSESTPFTRVWTTLSDTQTYPDPATGTTTPVYEGGAAMADFAGDGLGDFLWTDGTNLYRIPNNGPAANPQFGTQQTLGVWSGSLGGVVLPWGLFYDSAMNFDGSGREGRMGFEVKRVQECLKQGSGGSCIYIYPSEYFWDALLPSASGFTATASLSCFLNNMVPLPFDATGGGLTDLLYACQEPVWKSSPPPSTFDYFVELSTGTEFDPVDTGVTYSSNDPVFADYYGDGRQETIVYNGSSWSRVRVNYDPASENFVAAVSPTNAPYPGGYVAGSMQVGSIEADGLDDLVYAVKDSAGAYVWHYNLHAVPAGGAADVVTGITDGLGNSYSPSYAPLTNTPAYTEGSGAIYPNQDVKSPLYVVTSYQTNDGTGGTYTESYTYSGAQTEVTGRGFLGFASRSVNDSRNGVIVTDTYDQTFPLIGALTSETVAQSNGNSLNTLTNTYADTTTGSGSSELYFPHLASSMLTAYGTDGNALKTVNTVNTFDSYGDITGQTVTTTDKTSGATGGQIFTTQTTTGYANDTTNYCIDLPISMSVTKTNPSGSLTRSTASPQDPSACRPQYVELNPGTSPFLKQAYAYDPWGNPASVTVTGTLLVSRTSTADYTTYNGEYPDTITNALGQSATESWDPSRGVQLSVTDANLHTTSVGYDAFGRRTSENTPTGSTGVALGWGYVACGSLLPNGQTLTCPANGVYGVWASSNTQSLLVGISVYDAKGRAIETQKTLLGGAVSSVETGYNALGEVSSVSKPFFGSAPTYFTNTNYDVLGRPIQITAPANQADTGGNSDVTAISYSGFTTTANKVQTPTPPSGISNEQTVTSTDALGEVLSKTDGSGTVAATISYSYDPFGDLHSTTDADSPSHNTTMGYDALGHKNTLTDPNMGTWTYTPDALGEVRTQTDADNQTIKQVYDVLGRLSSRTEYNASGDVTVSGAWNYDSAPNGIGLLASESDSNEFSKTYVYDNFSRPITVDTTVPGTAAPYAVDTGYDSFGRISTVTYPASVAPSVPVASAVAAPTSAAVGTNINLDGSGSTDPSGLSLSYQWSGPAGASIANPTGKTTTVTTNTPGSYAFQLVVSDGNASSTPATVAVSFTPPVPGTPTINQSPQYSSSYTVNWGSVTGASSYQVYASSDGTEFNYLKTVTSDSDSVTGQTTGTYYYKVDACENGVCSALSASSAAVQVILPPTAAPTGLQVSPNPSADGIFTLSWTGLTGATYYNVYLSGNGTPQASPASSPASLSQGDGTDTYYVKACDLAGCGPASSTVSETVAIPPGTPGTPSTNPNPSDTNPSSFTVSWSAPSGGPGWTSGELEESTDQVNWTVETSWTSSSPATTWPGGGALFGNGIYYFRTVYCENSCGGSAVSYSGAASETVYLPPSPPTGLGFTPPGTSTNGNYTLSWSASATATSYNIYQNGTNFNSTGNTSWSFSGMADGTYSYYVTACNHSACSPASGTVSETVLHIPGAPATLTVEVNPTLINVYYTLTWGTAPGTVSYYKVNGSSSLEYPSSSRSASYKQSAPGFYSYEVQACNASGCGSDSPGVTEWVKTISCFGSTRINPDCTRGIQPPPSAGTVSDPGASPLGSLAPTSESSGMLSEFNAVREAPNNYLPVIPAEAGIHPNQEAMIPGANTLMPTPVVVAGSGLLATLAQERQRFTAGLPQQMPEAAMQAQATQREQAALPSLLPPAPAEDVAAWQTWDAARKQQNPTAPEFAPPEYLAYASAKYQRAVGTAYRFEVQYDYDPASGALIQVENAQTGFVYWNTPPGTAPVDAFGHLLAWTDGNNVSTVMAYDAATGAPVGISTDSEINGNQVVDQLLTYTWDGYGNLEKRDDANRTLSENFSYDDLNRLGGSTVTNPSANGPTLGMKYDPMGNIHTRTVNGVTSTYTYDPNHPYAVNGVTNSSGTTVYSASYDNDGNMITRNGSLIQWSVDNLPTSIASGTNYSTFSYGPDHDRYYQSAYNGVTTDTTYIGGLFELVSSVGSTEYRHNIMANGQVIAVHTITSSGVATTSYLHYDHLGSVDTITDDSGNVIQSQSMSFDAFGLRRDASNWDYDLTAAQIAALKNDTDRGYTFQEQLDNVGLVHMNGRVYDPTIGRFISADPTISRPFFSQGFNRYAYVDNSPLENTDPSGFEKDACQLAGEAQECLGPTGTAIGTIIGQPGPGEWGYQGPDGSSCNLVACTPGSGAGGDPSMGNNQNMSLATSQTAELGKIEATCDLSCQAALWAQQEAIWAQETQQFLYSQGIQNFFTQSQVNPFNNIWSYFLYSYSSQSAFLAATPNGYSRLAIRGLEIGRAPVNLPILSTQQEDLIFEEAVSLSNPISSLLSQDLNIFSDDEGFFHTDIFLNNNGSIQTSGFFNSPDNGNIGPDQEYLQYNNINAFIFGPLIPSSQINLNPPGFGPGSYNLISHNCQSYILCALGPGG